MKTAEGREHYDDSKGEGYIYERRSSRIIACLKKLKKKKNVIIKAEECYVCHTPLVKMEFKHSDNLPCNFITGYD